MDELAISVRGLGKQYRLGLTYKSIGTLGDAVAGLVARTFRREAADSRASSNERFWALRDVSFDVQRGEVVGVIGRNGAGKTTLLKIISEITEPTTGQVHLRGRVASLLEVGMGFHPEMTGRENVFLNGSILGMTRPEIKRKFDEIVDFAGTEKFIDTPLKRYSTGMRLRLAFAVAAHLDPDVLVIDEVLAVGDVEYQRKCLGKMEEVGRGGRTVLFVSHNMSAVMRLCPRVLLLDEGKLVADGEAAGVIKRYFQADGETTAERVWKEGERVASNTGSDAVRLKSVSLRDESGQITETFDIEKPIQVEIAYSVLGENVRLAPAIHVYNEEGVAVFTSVDSRDQQQARSLRKRGDYKSTCTIPGHFVAEGRFHVTVALYDPGAAPVLKHAYAGEAVAFYVKDNLDGDSARGTFGGKFPGVVRPILQWSTESRSDAS